MSNKNRRILRNKLAKKDSRIKSIPAAIFATALVIFCIVQLVINALLTPLGAELQSFDVEKEHLLEENRSLEEDLASSNSLTVVEHVTEKTLKLEESVKKQVVYVSDHTVRAQQ